ncbi:dynamin family protein [Ureibacillus manganicus]|uniref:Dynamin N-terminal domain-containing protein n=1 Tax=Ureibacillus manganicus DSM 26584 TaxID=1384049 RepID=A0A0A3I5S4_9BACL|nr:dynamin family protein [Ureibacillus manganicus]KGR80079.1 hypothetical protein CD29_03800 [Ureibacillus manganicus DSM 26584]
MTLQQNFIEIEKLFGKYNLSTQDVQKDIQHMNDFKVTTPIIGGFSTGKSSMINAFLDQRLLRTNITAETAVPAEITYGEPIVKIVKDNQQQLITLEDLLNQEYSIHDTDFIQIQLLNNELAKLPTIQLVDMPGFDSGIKAHNTAIDQYLPKSLAYILTFAADEPVVKESIADFLKELKLFEVPVYVCITKADKVSEDVLATNIQSIRTSIEKLLGVAPKKVVAIWSKKNKNTDGLQEILADIEANSREIFHKKFTALQQQHAKTIEQYITEMLKGTELSVSELDEKEAKLLKDIEHVQVKIEREQERFEKQLDGAISAIQMKIEQELHNNKEALQTQLMRGGDIQSKLNIILRTAVTAGIKEEFEPKLQQHIQKLTHAIQLDIPIDTSIQLDDFKIQTDHLMKELAIKALPLILGAIGVALTGPIGGLLLGIGTLLAELFFKKKREDELKAEAERKVTGEIIPFVVQEAGGLVGRELQQYTTTIHEAIQEEVGKQRDLLQKALQDVRKQKENEQSQQEDLKKQLNADLQRVRGLLYDTVGSV